MTYLGDVVDHLDQVLDCRDGRPGGSEVIGVRKWILPTNWKFAAENFLGDTYHNPSAPFRRHDWDRPQHPSRTIRTTG